MTKIAIVYGTTGGNTKLVCDRVRLELEKKGHKVDMYNAEITSKEVFSRYDTFILASPTYGHGLLDPHIIPFYDSLEGVVNFSRKLFAIIGLGDDKYDADYNVEAALILSDFAKRHGGQSLLHPLMINKCPISHLNTTVLKWGAELNERLQ